MHSFRLICAITLFAMTSISSPANAENKVFSIAVSDALASPEAHEKLDGSVKFYFGDAPHPAILQTFREYVTNQKTNNFLKSDRGSCTHVFISALIELQKRAQELGANAVINIHSYYKKEDVTIGYDVPCHVGAMIAGIALRGNFVKTAGR